MHPAARASRRSATSTCRASTAARAARARPPGDVKKLLDEMKKQKVAGVILDIRSNGGGLLSDAIDITGALIDKGPVVQVQDSDGQKEVLGRQAQGHRLRRPGDRAGRSVQRVGVGDSRRRAAGLQPRGDRRHRPDARQRHGADARRSRSRDRRQDRARRPQDHDPAVLPRPAARRRSAKASSPTSCCPIPPVTSSRARSELEHAIAWSQITPAPLDKWQVTYNTHDARARRAPRASRSSRMLAKIATATQVLKSRRNDTKVPLAAHRVGEAPRRSEGRARGRVARSQEGAAEVHGEAAGRIAGASRRPAGRQGRNREARRSRGEVERQPRPRSVGRRVAEHPRRHDRRQVTVCARARRG